ncbi:MAG: alginate export family protein, partial [Saprospiraceae bacterium]
FFFRPESTINYKEAGIAEDTGQLNFYLRGDFGGRLSLPKNIDMVFNLQSYGFYTRALGPLDSDLSLYEAYVDMKKLDRAGKLSLRFGRMCLGKYGTEILVGDDDFIKGRSFESVRFRYQTAKTTSDLMWVQLYQSAPDSADFDWNHPIFLGNFNTFRLREAINFDVNLVYIIDQFISGFRTSVLMPDVRLFGQSNHFRYSAEMIYQVGETNGILTDDVDGKVNAYAFEVSAGYFADDNNMGIDVTYYRASGDDEPTDDHINTYNVLWQNEHRRFGFIDAFKGSNVQATTLHLSYKPGRLIETGIHAVFAQVLETEDRSTGIATIPSLNGLDPQVRSIGVGGDWYLNYYFNHYFNMQVSASVFSPGDYFTTVNGIDETMVRMYLMLAARI